MSATYAVWKIEEGGAVTWVAARSRTEAMMHYRDQPDVAIDWDTLSLVTSVDPVDLNEETMLDDDDKRITLHEELDRRLDNGARPAFILATTER
jgi:hypothetical protein